MLDIRDFKNTNTYVKADSFEEFKTFAIEYMPEIDRPGNWGVWFEKYGKDRWKEGYEYFRLGLCGAGLAYHSQLPSNCVVYKVKDFLKNELGYTLMNIKEWWGRKVVVKASSFEDFKRFVSQHLVHAGDRWDRWLAKQQNDSNDYKRGYIYFDLYEDCLRQVIPKGYMSVDAKSFFEETFTNVKTNLNKGDVLEVGDIVRYTGPVLTYNEQSITIQPGEELVVKETVDSQYVIVQKMKSDFSPLVRSTYLTLIKKANQKSIINNKPKNHENIKSETIKVNRITSTIERGPTIGGSTISGKTKRAAISIRPLSNQTIAVA